jgi:hypothetical protein
MFPSAASRLKFGATRPTPAAAANHIATTQPGRRVKSARTNAIGMTINFLRLAVTDCRRITILVPVIRRRSKSNALVMP